MASTGILRVRLQGWEPKVSVFGLRITVSYIDSALVIYVSLRVRWHALAGVLRMVSHAKAM